MKTFLRNTTEIILLTGLYILMLNTLNPAFVGGLTMGLLASFVGMAWKVSTIFK